MSYQSAMLTNMKENQRVQIRKNQRELIFKQKRIIQFIEQTLIDSDNFREFIENKMTACINIYNHMLPQSMNELTETLIQIKQVNMNQEQIEAFIMAIFKKDFVKFLMIFLHDQYDQQAVQYQAALILANFFGMIKQNSPLYLSAYIPMLNYQGGNIVSCVGRLLLSKNEQLIEAALFILGNLFCDQSCVVDEFRRQFGMNLILQLRTSDVIWILELLFQNRVYFSTQELIDSVEFIDQSILKCQPEEYHLKQCLLTLQYGALYLKDLYNMIPRLQSFAVLFSSQQFTTLAQLANSSDLEMLQKLAKQYDYVEFISERLSSRSKEELVLSLKTLTLLIKKDKRFIGYVLSQQYTLERIIALASQTDQSIIVAALKLIKAILSYREARITTQFLEKNLMPLIAQVLDYVHDKIIDLALEILCCILDVKDDFSSDEQKFEVGRLFSHHQIADKIFLAYSNSRQLNMKLVEQILNEITYFENLS